MTLASSFKKIFQSWIIVSFGSSFLSVFFFSSTSLALTIPYEAGYIQEEIKGSNGKTLILIQEAHVDYGAQKSIAAILKDLIQKDSLRLILVEGGWDRMGISFLRSYGSPQGRLEVAERYLREGLISGEEYLDIVSDLPMELWGVEDPELYKENMKAFLAVDVAQKNIMEEITRLENILTPIKTAVYSPGLLEFENKTESFRRGTLLPLDYLQHINKHYPGMLTVDFPILKNLSVLSGLNGIYDLAKAQWEKENLIRVLSKRLTKPELEEIDLLKNRETSSEELALIESLLGFCDLYPGLQKSTPLVNLKHYAISLKGLTRVDSNQLWDELEALGEKTAAALIQNEEQKKLRKINHSFGTLKKLFELQLTSREFERFGKNRADFKLDEWKNFLTGKSKSLPSTIESWPDFDHLQKQIFPTLAFYDAAVKREKALIENAMKKFEKEKDTMAAMITGGFHTDHLAQAFKDRGYSVLTVSPRFSGTDSKEQHERYLKILKSKWDARSQDLK